PNATVCAGPLHLPSRPPRCPASTTSPDAVMTLGHMPAPKKGITPRYALYLLALLTALNFLNYVDRQVITSMYADLRAHFGFSDPQIGWFSSAFFFMHAVTTVPF